MKIIGFNIKFDYTRRNKRKPRYKIIKLFTAIGYNTRADNIFCVSNIGKRRPIRANSPLVREKFTITIYSKGKTSKKVKLSVTVYKKMKKVKAITLSKKSSVFYIDWQKLEFFQFCKVKF